MVTSWRHKRPTRPAPQLESNLKANTNYSRFPMICQGPYIPHDPKSPRSKRQRDTFKWRRFDFIVFGCSLGFCEWASPTLPAGAIEETYFAARQFAFIVLFSDKNTYTVCYYTDDSGMGFFGVLCLRVLSEWMWEGWGRMGCEYKTLTLFCMGVYLVYKVVKYEYTLTARVFCGFMSAT